MGINKVVYGNTTLIDLTDSTLASADQLSQGITAYDRTGTKITGTATGGAGAFSDTVVQLPNGGDHHIITGVDISNDTVTAAHLESGYTAHDASGTAITGTLVPGGGDQPAADAVRFIDYDGTILHTYSASEFLALSAMPANPTHAGLTAQGWNWTLEEAQEHVEDWEYLDIGQSYITSDGTTQIDITLHEGRLAPYLGIAVNGEVSVDWGDNSTATTITGSSSSTQICTLHEYSAAGNYTIKITVVTGGFAFHSPNSAYSLLNDNKNNSNTARVYSNCVKAIRIGNDCTISSSNAFTSCTGVRYITIPTTVGSSSTFTTNNCYNLKAIIMPRKTTAYSTTVSASMNYSLDYLCLASNENCSYPSLQGCTCLDRVILPKGVYGGSPFPASGSPSVFSNVYIGVKNGLKIVRPIEVTQSLINQQWTDNNSPKYGQFSSLRVQKEITIPSAVTALTVGSVFGNCMGLKKIIFPSTTEVSQSFCSSTSSLQSVTVKLKNYSSASFTGCTALKDVSLTVTSTGTSVVVSMFSSCPCLESFIIPSGITAVSSAMFSSCYTLTDVTIPNTVTTINSSAFSNCYCLAKIVVPASVTTIQASAFQFCYGMAEYHFLGTTPPTLGGTNVFSNIPSDCKIYVPSSALSDYQTAQYWSTYASYMVGE